MLWLLCMSIILTYDLLYVSLYVVLSDSLCCCMIRFMSRYIMWIMSCGVSLPLGWLDAVMEALSLFSIKKGVNYG